MGNYGAGMVHQIGDYAQIGPGQYRIARECMAE
jgi:hypothetical protein